MPPTTLNSEEPYYLAYLIQQVTLLNVLPLWIESIRKFDEQTNNVINNQKNQY